MIEYIRGTLEALTPAEATVEAAGVGYQLFISLNTYTAVQGKREVKLYAYEAIREDAHVLFGFATKLERELFTLLMRISGVGGQTARTVLSAFTPAELAVIIQNEDTTALRSVKGIGPKAAGRIVVELKDRMPMLGADAATALPAGKATPAGKAQQEAVGALTTLGFPPAAVQKTVTALLRDDAAMSVEDIIKKALKLL